MPGPSLSLTIHIPELASAISLLTETRDLLRVIAQKETKIMASVQDVQAKNTELAASISGITDVVNSAKVLIEGNSATLASLRQQLADAIANGADPAAFQAVVDAMAAEKSGLDSAKDALAAAVVAGTSA